MVAYALAIAVLAIIIGLVLCSDRIKKGLRHRIAR